MCAILGIISKNRRVIEDGIVLLGAQNHRGEQGCGAASFNGKSVNFYRGPGLVKEVFCERDYPKWSKKMDGSAVVMHTVYSTVSPAKKQKKQKKQPITKHPMVFNFCGRKGAISHNGNIVGLDELKKQTRKDGYKYQSATSDTEVIAALLSTSRKHHRKDFLEALIEVLKKIEGKGSFSLVILYDGKLYGVRDQNGNRPLCIIKKNGKNGDHDSYIFSSETCVFTALEATRVIRFVGEGELVVLGKNGVERSIQWTNRVKPALCINEFIYFAHPASVLCNDCHGKGCSVYRFRLESGRMSAEKHPVKADVMVAIPEAGRGFTDGFSQRSKIVSLQGIMRNPQASRTFLQPRHVSRADLQRSKLQAIPDVMEGKNVCLGEDSVFRSSVGRMASKMCREHGKAKGVGMRVGSAKVRWGCHLGIDHKRKELVAVGRSTDQIREIMNLDSLAYLTVHESKQVLKRLGLDPKHFCMGCYTGKFPVPPPKDEA